MKMQTELLEREPETTTAEPTRDKDAVQLYRESVFNFSDTGEMPDDSVLIDAGRTRADFKADFAVYGSRLNAVHDLNVRVPEMEEQLRDAEQRAAAVGDICRVRLEDIETVEDLVQALQEYQRYCDSVPSPDPSRPRPTIKTAEQAEAQQLQQNISSVRGRVQEVLAKTAAIDPALAALYVEQSSLQRELASRCQPNLAAMIEAKRLEVAQLVVQPNQDSRKPHREQLAVAKHELAKLEARLASPADCVDHGEQGRLDAVNGKIAKLEEARLSPKNMKWQ